MEDAWIAQELWFLAHRPQMQREAFERAVCFLLRQKASFRHTDDYREHLAGLKAEHAALREERERVRTWIEARRGDAPEADDPVYAGEAHGIDDTLNSLTALLDSLSAAGTPAEGK